MSELWPKEERGLILDDIWRGRDSRCPTDGTTLRTRMDRMLNGDYVATARCPRCGTNVQMSRADDPFLAEFRPWTDEDKQYLADEALDKRHPRCPVDDTPLKVIESAHVDRGATVVLLCPRCSQRHSERFPRQAAGNTRSGT